MVQLFLFFADAKQDGGYSEVLGMERFGWILSMTNGTNELRYLLVYQANKKEDAVVRI
jgi:hypothetical protein